MNSYFSFPAKFRLSSILPSISLPHDEYELVSVFIHEGTVRTGHYYSYSRAGERGEWVMFNDNVVEKVEFERVVANAFGCDGEVGDERASCGRASRLGLSGDLSGDLSDDLSDDWNGDLNGDWNGDLNGDLNGDDVNGNKGTRLGLNGGRETRGSKLQSTASAYLLLYVRREDGVCDGQTQHNMEANARLLRSFLLHHMTTTVSLYMQEHCYSIRLLTLSQLQHAALTDCTNDFVPASCSSRFLWKEEELTSQLLSSWGEELGVPPSKQVEFGGGVEG